MSTVPGYAGKLLRVDLSQRSFTNDELDENTIRPWVGGTALGAKLLYDGVPAGVEWSDPANILILAAGPMNGAHLPGTGTFTVVTKGPLTNGASASQANGYFGAYLKFSGFDAVVIQGQAKDWTYLYLHDGMAELRDAASLVGKDTMETEEAIKKELGKREHGVSVYSIGPAGENLVRFAAIVGDKGHVAGHNGMGAVMGSKKLKAVVADRSRGTVAMHDTKRLTELRAIIEKEILADPVLTRFYNFGTKVLYTLYEPQGLLPVKNATSAIFPQHASFTRPGYIDQVELKPHRCWTCNHKSCHTLKIKEGPYAGFEGEEPDYELMVAFGCLIGNLDVMAAITLNDEADRLGLEGNESGWLMSWLMDCYERGYLNKKDTDGLEMTWGNVEAVRTLLRRIARRQGFGNVLAEGVKRASQAVGGEAARRAVYQQKGHAPRGHDHRARWNEILDVATSNTGTVETAGIVHPEDIGLPPFTDQFSPEQVPFFVAKAKGVSLFKDSLVMCFWTTGHSLANLAHLVNAATGWDFSAPEALKVGERAANILRCFNIRHGLTPELEYPSPKYGSAPEDGPAKGKNIMDHWGQMLDRYYEAMGWDRKTGKPLPQTLRSYGLDYAIPELWGPSSQGVPAVKTV